MGNGDMATNTSNSASTPGEIKDGEDVPSNLDAARPVIDRIKDIDAARDEAGVSGGDTVIDNTPETAEAEAKAGEDAKAAEKGDDAEPQAKKGSKRSTARE